MIRRRKKNLVIEPYVDAVIELEEVYVRAGDRSEQHWRVTERHNIWGYFMDPIPDEKKRFVQPKGMWVRPEKLADDCLWRKVPRCT